jgi:hypothetical protein
MEEYEEYGNDAADQDVEGVRMLQDSGELTTLTMTFTRCLFVVSGVSCGAL